MKTFVILLGACAATTFSDSVVDQFNALGYGIVSGRLQSLSMYRDYDNGNNAYSTTLGLKLDYLSPEKEGWIAGASYIGAGVLDSMDYGTSSNPGDALVGNGRVNILNEAYLSYNAKAFGLANTTGAVGRKVNNGEVFRADDFRQKPRSIEHVAVESKELHKTRIQVGHAWEMSNWIDADPLWKFEEFDRLGIDGITWGEMVNHCAETLEIAVFDAIAYDMANLLGTRIRFAISDETALLGYARWENDIGDGADRDALALGLSVEQKIEDIKIEAGYLGVSGDGLFFQETTTGINHALGASMMIFTKQFNAGADTLYAKAVMKPESTQTTICSLFNYTILDEDKIDIRQAQELNLVIKQPIPKIDNLTASLKIGAAYCDGVNGAANLFATDTRLFITCTF